MKLVSCIGIVPIQVRRDTLGVSRTSAYLVPRECVADNPGAGVVGWYVAKKHIKEFFIDHPDAIVTMPIDTIAKKYFVCDNPTSLVTMLTKFATECQERLLSLRAEI